MINTFDDSADARIGRASPGITTGTWYFFVATYDGSAANSGFKLYQDGVQVDNSDSSGGSYTAMENMASLVRLGFEQGLSGERHFFKGQLAGGPCGPFFTHKKLSATEVSQLYNQCRTLLGLP